MSVKDACACGLDGFITEIIGGPIPTRRPDYWPPPSVPVCECGRDE